jgi:hypothetical protein
MLISPKWRVRLGEVVLLDWDDFSQGEPLIRRDCIPRAKTPVGASHSTQLGATNVSHTLSLSRVRRFANGALARSFVLAHTAALPSSAVACTIELHADGGEAWLLADAVLQPGFTCRPECERVFAEYTVIGGALSLTAAPPWLTTEGGGALLGEDGAALLPES